MMQTITKNDLFKLWNIEPKEKFDSTDINNNLVITAKDMYLLWNK